MWCDDGFLTWWKFCGNSAVVERIDRFRKGSCLNTKLWFHEREREEAFILEGNFQSIIFSSHKYIGHTFVQICTIAWILYSSLCCVFTIENRWTISFLTPITVYSCFDDIQETLPTQDISFRLSLFHRVHSLGSSSTSSSQGCGRNLFWQYAFPLSSLDADISVTVFYSLTHRLKKPVPFFSGLFEAVRTITPQGSSLKVTMCCVQR